MAETGAFTDVLLDPVPPGLTSFQRIKAILGGSAGNLVEWYDWFAYTGFSIYFASEFFPKGDNTAQLLSAALLNIVSFGARPIGAWERSVKWARRRPLAAGWGGGGEVHERVDSQHPLQSRQQRRTLRPHGLAP